MDFSPLELCLNISPIIENFRQNKRQERKRSKHLLPGVTHNWWWQNCYYNVRVFRNNRLDFKPTSFLEAPDCILLGAFNTASITLATAINATTAASLLMEQKKEKKIVKKNSKNKRRERKDFEEKFQRKEGEKRWKFFWRQTHHSTVVFFS